jgi:hypothetical protein
MEQSAGDLEDLVVRLEHEHTFHLPSQVRPENHFLVVNDLLHVVDETGPLQVYNIKTQQETARFSYKRKEVRAIATDGSRIYLHVQKDFEVRDSDILIAKTFDRFENKTDDGKTFSDGMCDFFGKTLDGLPPDHKIYGRANVNSVTGKIVSYSLQDLPFTASVYDPDVFTNRNTRFLVHKDMTSLIFLLSGKNHIIVGYNNHCGEGGCEDYCVITSSGDIVRRLPAAETDEEKGEEPHVHISQSRRCLSAELTSINEELLLKNIPLMFSGGRPAYNGEIAKIQQRENKLHVLYYTEVTQQGVPNGVSRIENQARLDTYAISLKRLSPV